MTEVNTFIKNVVVGDRLPDTPYDGPYGYYFDRVIVDIQVTKGGRFWLFVESSYKAKSGEVVKEKPHKRSYSNGALSGLSPITIWRQ